MPESTVAGGGAWLGIDELARRVGAYCWIEHRIFELSGTWATVPARRSAAGTDSGIGLEAERRLWCAAVSAHHGALAGCWAERLPVRAGVDRVALVAAPDVPLAGALGALGAEPDPWTGMAALVQGLLPRLEATYLAHARAAAPVREAPVLEVLAVGQRLLRGEIEGGRPLVDGHAPLVARAAQLGDVLERSFEQSSIFPAVRPS